MMAVVMNHVCNLHQSVRAAVMRQLACFMAGQPHPRKASACVVRSGTPSLCWRLLEPGPDSGAYWAAVQPPKTLTCVLG
jgi:hypothetical protein